MYEERGKTLPDGRIEVIVSDPSTGQEVVRYYSPGAEPKVSLGDLVLKDGFLRDELMPPSVAKKDDLTPLATKEELRTATNGLLARSEVMDGDKIKTSLLPVPNVTAADGSSLLGSDGKIRHDLLPEAAGGSAEGGSVDLQPLENRVAALEAKPEAEHVDLNPLSERVAALENAPKVADKSQEVTALQGEVSTLQGTVAEHTTSIASNDRRITALESRPAPESMNLQPLNERVTALEGKASILGEDGKVKADFLPDSCKGEHCEAPTLPSDVVRTADIEDVVRKSALFDTAHNMILPELIPEAEVAVKWLKGKGRPDKPETTEGAIVGDEADCTRYLSTDGAGTGALEWEKRGGVWHVVRGDTGWREIENPQKYFGKIRLRRVDDRISLEFGGGQFDSFGVVKLSKSAQAEYPEDKRFSARILQLPNGWRSCTNAMNQIFDDTARAQIGMVVIGGMRDGAGNVDMRFVKTVDRETDLKLLRVGIVTFPTVDEWPTSLMGVASAMCPV